MLRSRRLVAAFAGIVILAGILMLRSAPVDVLPEFLPPTVDIQTEALGLSAVEVEQLITVPLEQDLLRGVAWLSTIQSQSVPGLSSIHLTFDPGTSLYKARALVQERIQSADLANVSRPPQMLQPTSATGRVMMIGLSSKTMSLMQMSVLARWTIAPKLMGVPGVANVATWGQRDQQLQVMVDPQRLQQSNVSLDDIITTTGNALWYSPLSYLEAAVPGTGGFIDTSNQRLTIMHLLPITSPDELAQVPIDLSGEQMTAASTTTTTAAGGSTTPITGQGTGTTGAGGGTTQTSTPVSTLPTEASPLSKTTSRLTTTQTTAPPPGSTGTTGTAATTATTAAPTTTTTAAPTTTTTAAPLRLGDVATIVQDHQPLIGDAVFTNGPGLLLVIDKLPGADVYQVTKGIQNAMNELGPGLSDIKVDYGIFRPATYLEQGISNLVLGLIIGCALLLVTLGVFFLDWRRVLMSAVVIALGLAVAELLLRLLGFSLNWMTLAGLVIGLIAALDVVVSSVANMRRRLAEVKTAEEPGAHTSAILQAARETRGVVVYTMIIVLIALLPIFAVRGATGALVRSLSLSFALVVAASTVAALLVTPALALMLVPTKGAGRGEGPVVRWLKRGYQRALTWMIALPRRSYVPAIVIFVVAAAMVPFLNTSLLPALKDTNILVQLDAQPGTSLTEMSRVVGLVAADVKAVPGVKEVGGSIGRAVLGDQVVNVNSSVLWVNVDGTKDYGETLDAIGQAVAKYPGLDSDVITYPNSRISDAALGPKNELTVRIYGEDLDTLRSKAAQVTNAIKNITGVGTMSVENLAEEPGINIEVNLAAAERYGVKPGDVRRDAATLLSGLTVGSLYEQEKIFDVVVWGTPQIRSNLDTIRNLLINTPSGATVKLSDVADVSIGPNPTAVYHDGGSRKIDVTVNVQGRSASEVAEDIQSRLTQVAMPLDYHAEVLGSYQQVEAIQIWMLVLGAAAVLGIFLLLQSILASWRLAVLSFLGSLAAVSGGVAAAFFMDRTISPAALLALVPVFGIAVRYSVLLVRDCRECERQESQDPNAAMNWVPSLNLVVQTAGGQFGVLLMTIIAAGLALLPLAIMGDVAGLEVLHEPVVALLSSLVTLAFVSLFVAPALYLRFGQSWRKHDATT